MDAHGDPRRYIEATGPRTQEADRQARQQGQASAALDSHSRSDVHVDLENFPRETVIPCRAAAPDSSVVVISSDDEDP